MNCLWDIPVEVSLKYCTSSNVCEVDAQTQCCSELKWDIDLRNKTHTRLILLTDLGPVGMEFCVFVQLASKILIIPLLNCSYHEQTVGSQLKF